MSEIYIAYIHEPFSDLKERQWIMYKLSPM